MKICCHCEILVIIQGFSFASSLLSMIFVVIGFLQAGSSLIILTSNSQKNAKVNDLGIGVAVICSM